MLLKLHRWRLAGVFPECIAGVGWFGERLSCVASRGLLSSSFTILDVVCKPFRSLYILLRYKTAQSIFITINLLWMKRSGLMCLCSLESSRVRVGMLVYTDWLHTCMQSQNALHAILYHILKCTCNFRPYMYFILHARSIFASVWISFICNNQLKTIIALQCACTTTKRWKNNQIML